MSLRTKLIAAIVCLPGAILLLAILLFAQEGRATPPEAIVRVIRLASSDERATIGPGMLKELEAGNFAEAYVLRDASTRDPAANPREAWSLRAFYDEPRGSRRPDVVDPAQIAHLFRTKRGAYGAGPPFVLRNGFLAVAARGKDSRDRPYAFVLRLHERRRTAQAVYWVMVGGIVLLIIVFTLLITTWVIQPLRKLSAAADRIADGDFHIKMEPSNAPDEFGRTFRALNRMASEIGEYQGQLEERVLAALGRIKKTEQHLVIAQRLAATGKLAAGLAHEINNPLGGMKNAVNALCRGDLSEEKTALYFDLVTDGLGRVEQTVKKFLTYTPRRVEPRPTDLADVVQKSVALARHRLDRLGIVVETTFPGPGEAVVFGDPHELQQVALNLVLNAVDAIGPGHPGGAIFVEVARRDHDVVLRVRDNGGGMKNAVNALCRGDLSEEKTALYFDLVTDSLGRVEQTVKKFLTYTPRRVEPRPTDLADVVQKSVALARHRLDRLGIVVETTLPGPGEAVVFGDPHELQQVALNLVLNAVDAIGPGHPGGAIFVEVARRDHDVVLRVRDNGGGMSLEDQERCFDMFFTTKAVGEGSGMGLAVVHNIVSNHGGRIELSSQVGEGSTFEVILPEEVRARAAEGLESEPPEPVV